MEFTWISLFQLVEKMWGLNQAAIAKCLGCHESTISRLTNGKCKTFNKPLNEIYTNLFSPSNVKLQHLEDKGNTRGSDAYKRILLSGMICTIDEMGLKEAIKDINKDDYETFVTGLLRLIKKNEPPKRKLSKKTFNSTKKSNEEATTVSQKEVKWDQLSDIFEQSFEEYGIDDFIDRHPVDSLTSVRILDAVHFLGSMGYGKQNDQEYLDKNEEVYHNIKTFGDVLFKYISCLKKHSINPDNFLYDYKPCKDNVEMFIEEVNKYQKELKSLSIIIKEEVDKKRKSGLEEQKNASKSIWQKAPDAF